MNKKLKIEDSIPEYLLKKKENKGRILAILIAIGFLLFVGLAGTADMEVIKLLGY